MLEKDDAEIIQTILEKYMVNKNYSRIQMMDSIDAIVGKVLCEMFINKHKDK